MKISLQRRHALKVADSAYSHEIDYVTIFEEILNPEGHPICTYGSKVTAILLNGWILPIVGASSGMVCACRLVFKALATVGGVGVSLCTFLPTGGVGGPAPCLEEHGHRRTCSQETYSN